MSVLTSLSDSFAILYPRIDKHSPGLIPSSASFEIKWRAETSEDKGKPQSVPSVPRARHRIHPHLYTFTHTWPLPAARKSLRRRRAQPTRDRQPFLPPAGVPKSIIKTNYLEFRIKIRSDFALGECGVTGLLRFVKLSLPLICSFIDLSIYWLVIMVVVVMLVLTMEVAGVQWLW